ncbi:MULTISPECIES: NAD(P)-dependent oxidoreductase [Lactobacillaceae]|nr:NAD(P)H-binding protein [Ligilactobacillus saerimneri]
MTKVGIIGASGMAGQAIYHLATLTSGLTVTGIVRHEKRAKEVLGNSAQLIVKDVLALDNQQLAKFDVLVDAFNPGPQHAEQQVTLAQKLVQVAATNTNMRLIFILGAGSLLTGQDRHRFVDDIAKVPGADKWINTPKQQFKELEYLATVNNADWLGISPSMTFEEGPATGYVIGGDDLLFDDKGASKVTSGTMAKLIVNEIVKPQHHRERITVINA